ncbi:hypothetical protein NLI92_002165 [Priestia megaterium]|uniref:hypothetical protein n=1 Tax=Priestia megaterium TaxID=1404 RepID=UPI0021ABB3C7|nr:hypothetical protein [Priestia megaterium]MCR8926815.1 hypothetical protein [Priestia megaterium]
MNLVGQQKLFEVPSSMQNMDEDIVYSVIERYSRKASEPTTTRSFTTSSLILNMKEALGFLESLFIYQGINVINS